MVETDVHVTKDYNNEQIQGLELSTSYINSAPQNSSFESFEHRKRSLIHKDQSMQQINLSRGAQRFSLPKVLFAEWLSFDQDNVQDLVNYSGSAPGFKNNLDDHTSNFEATLIDSFLHNGGIFVVETNPKCTEVYVDDLLQSPFRKWSSRLFSRRVQLKYDDIYR